MSPEGRREIALLVAMASVLGLVDGLIPRPLPFLRLGLANIPAVIAVTRSGLGRTLELNAARVTVVALVTGTIATPTFLLSASGALASALVMAWLAGWFRRSVSITAVSAAGASASLWAQLLAAKLILRDIPVGALLPALSLWGVISGIITGSAAMMLMKRMPDLEALHINRA